MSHLRTSRRDFLKLLGTAGLFAPMSNLLRTVEAQSRTQTRTNPTRPNIIIFIFDALSARHMSLYGYQRKTTPNIDRFARTSTIFHQHHAASNYTKPSTASLLTGVLPWSHRALGYYSALLEFYDHANIFSETISSFYTLAYTHNNLALNVLEEFAAHINLLKPPQDLAAYDPDKLLGVFRNDYSMGSYAIEEWSGGGFLGPSTSIFMNPIVDIVQTLASSRVLEVNKKTYPLGLIVNGYQDLLKLEDAINWIAQCSTSTPQPYLGYFHLLPPHEPYHPRADFVGAFSGDNLDLPEKPTSYFSEGHTQEQLKQFRDLYDDYVAYADSEFGRLYGILEKNGALDNTYLILTSDHGQLFERGIHGHGVTLYEPVIHIPLIIHAPGQSQGKDIYSVTSNTDVLPTILQLANQSLPNWLEGKPLSIHAESGEAERFIFSMDGLRNSKFKPLTKATLSAIQWPYKLNNYRGYPGYDNVDELFDLGNDPEELNNLAASRPTIVAELKNELKKNQIIAEKKSIGSSINQD